MKRNKLTTTVPEKKTVTNADAISEIAEAITDSISGDISSGNLDTAEATGNLAMSILLTKYSEGLLDDKQAFAFFKEMASKKTQAPIQRVEQHVKIDLRAVFNDITESNQTIQTHTLQQAKQWDGDVRERLQLDDNMMLKPREEEQDSPPTFTPDPPPEIEDIRTGGDGSEKRQQWERQGAREPSYRKNE